MGPRSRLRVRLATVALVALLAVACKPVFPGGSTLDVVAASGTRVRLVWNTAYDTRFPTAGHLIDNYEVRVDGVLVATLPRHVASCIVNGLASATTYNIEVSAVTTSGERSDDLGGELGRLQSQYTTPPGGDPAGAMSCTTETDADGDRLPDWIETNTGVFVDKTNAGTDPLVADTDGDGLDDGDEVVGSSDGLALPQLGADPLKKNIFMEFDWFDDSQTCGPHSHRPSSAVIDRFEQAFADAPVANPDGTTGIDVISDYGQGGFTNGGKLVEDTIAPFGSINGGVNGAEFASIKEANFLPVREGYFHYVVMMHQYNTSSSSSGQAELPGDDLVVSLQCLFQTTYLSNTIMHELGHNLFLRHGGDVNLPNYKPNYNSVMNYRFQFAGVDADAGDPGTPCNANPDQIIDYSDGDRITLDEVALLEASGVCGSPAIDWDGDSFIDPVPVTVDVNADGLLQMLTDHDDWAAINFGGVGDADGLAFETEPEIIDEQPVPEQLLSE